MKQYYPALRPGAIFLSFVILLSSCRRINEATELGGDLIPAVDNITTFDTTVTVEAYNGIFTSTNDSLRLGRNDEHWLGRIDNGGDPLFGGTDARIFLELKPFASTTSKFGFVAPKDSTDIDSVVLILDYVETFGDTNALQTVNVYEIDQTAAFRRDSIYLIRENNFPLAGQLGSRTFAPSILNDSIKAFRDTTKNQLRIRLSDSFGARLLDYDSTGPSGGYTNDSVFRTNFKGFAIQSTSGKAVMGINLNGLNTKLAIYFKYDQRPTVNDSAVVQYFTFTPLSASANYIQRDHASGAIAGQQGGTSPDPLVFIQNAPGSFATIKIPDLAGLSNRLVHRAELIAEQALANPITDSLFYTPEYLYLDAFDPAISKFRTIPFDVTFDQTGNLNIGGFGMIAKNSRDPSGNLFKVWKFNLTRYVQHIFTRTEPLYDLRLYAPFNVLNTYRIPGTTTDQNIPPFVLNPSIVEGRVRLFGNTGRTDPNPQRLRLRIIYSKL